MKLEKLSNTVSLVYQVISELLKFVTFVENEDIGDFGGIKEKIPVVKKSLNAVKTALGVIAKLFHINIEEEAVTVLSESFDEKRLDELNKKIEKLYE